MKSSRKGKDGHSESGGHKGHGWMMLVCIALMVGIPLLILSSTAGGFSASLLGTAIIPIVLCLVMHGLMMKYMMSNTKKEDENNEKHAPNTETKLIEQPSKSSNQFKA